MGNDGKLTGTKGSLQDLGVTKVGGKALRTANPEDCGIVHSAILAETLPLKSAYTRADIRRAERAQETPKASETDPLEVLRNAIGIDESKVLAIATDAALDVVADFGIDEAKLEAAVEKAISGLPPMRIETSQGVRTLPDLRHESFDDLVRLIEESAAEPNDQNFMMVGPAGTGKTSIATQYASWATPKGKPESSFLISMSAGLSESSFFGRWLPVGAEGSWSFLLAEFAKVYGGGGALIIDEFDRGDGNALTALNAALANGFMSIPGHGRVERHPDTIIIVCANTWGDGGDGGYACEVLDKATLDRFTGRMLWVDYSPRIESAMIKANGDAGKRAGRWVWTLRARVAENSLDRLVSARMLKRAIAACLHGDDSWLRYRRSVLLPWSNFEREALGDMDPGKADAPDWAGLLMEVC